MTEKESWTLFLSFIVTPHIHLTIVLSVLSSCCNSRHIPDCPLHQVIPPFPGLYYCALHLHTPNRKNFHQPSAFPSHLNISCAPTFCTLHREANSYQHLSNTPHMATYQNFQIGQTLPGISSPLSWPYLPVPSSPFPLPNAQSTQA